MVGYASVATLGSGQLAMKDIVEVEGSRFKVQGSRLREVACRRRSSD
jgi:hypothetical protein